MLRIDKAKLAEIFKATEAKELTEEDFLSWLSDEIDEALEQADSDLEVVIVDEH